MPFSFECPHCHRQTLVDDRYSGQSGPCAGCGNTVTIPTLGRGGTAASPQGSAAGAIVVVMFGLLLVCGFLCAGVGLFWVRTASVPTAPATVAAASPCSNHLKALALAVHNYHDVYKTFPPAYVADHEGKPMHSWRVLLLPFIGRADLYAQYRFDEPWDGPNNSRLLAMIPGEYQCPEDLLRNFDQTSYAMIVGPGCLSDGPSASRMSDIIDGTSNTIMFAEAHGAGVAWTEPRDLDGTALTYLVNSGQPGQLQGHGGSLTVALCDGAVRELTASTPPAQLRALVSIGGGEIVAPP
ncbi:MAG: DUF1559 family PulG-like putative transporter [Thermoguttaceae bacterium]